MQDLLPKLLWKNFEIMEAADRLCRTMPGYREAQRVYEDLAEQVRQAAGDELYDQYFSQLIQYSDYEVYAYYALGLGLREELVQALGL